MPLATWRGVRADCLNVYPKINGDRPRYTRFWLYFSGFFVHVDPWVNATWLHISHVFRARINGKLLFRRTTLSTCPSRRVDFFG